MGTSTLDPKIKLNAVFVYIDYAEDVSDLPHFLSQGIPFAFQDPVHPSYYILCKNKKDLARAKYSRARANFSTIYPDYAALIISQGTHVFWYRPPAGDNDVLGTWLLFSWLYSQYKLKIEIDP